MVGGEVNWNTTMSTLRRGMGTTQQFLIGPSEFVGTRRVAFGQGLFHRLQDATGLLPSE